MARETRRHDTEPEQSETYVYDYDGAQTKKVVGGRTACVHGAFFLPYLHTITIGLAEAVAPGEVVGVDLEASQVDLARAQALERGLPHLRFETGNVYELPYGDKTFDAGFSHALLEHLSDPVKALQEIHRVLKPGGIIGIRSPDWAGTLVAPPNPVLETALKLYYTFSQHNGGNPFIGRHLRALLRDAGCVETKGSASYECFETSDVIRSHLDVLLSVFAGPRIVEQATHLGWADKSQFEEIVIALTEWSKHPDAFFAHTWCEAVGWKP
jgi:SAM-dependent methyltransferase